MRIRAHTCHLPNITIYIVLQFHVNNSTTGSRQAKFYIVTDHTMTLRQDMQWLTQLVAGPSTWMPGFNPRPVQVGFVAEKVALEQLPIRVFPFPLHYYSTSAPPSFVYHCSYIILANDITLNWHTRAVWFLPYRCVAITNIYYDRQSQQCSLLTCYLSYRMSYFRLHVSVIVWPSSGLQSYHVHVLIMQRWVYCRT